MKYTVIATCTIVLKLNSICFIFSSFQCQCNNRLWGLLFIWLKKLKSLTELLESGYVSCKYHRSNYTIFNFSSEPTVFGYLLPLRNIILRFSNSAWRIRGCYLVILFLFIRFSAFFIFAFFVGSRNDTGTACSFLHSTVAALTIFLLQLPTFLLVSSKPVRV